ncbi:hypothetical protein ABIB25_003761 [Nakamurella sp. UYEF19]|uniref:hypothetical protein n=1 Tax=Nakamurella sp. UYEF19 TaxID=1756392 RepID=UPI003399B565
MKLSLSDVPKPDWPSAGPRPTGGRMRRRLLAAIPVPIWVVLLFVLFGPLLRDLNGPLPGGADSVLYSWYFKEIQVSIWHGENPFFTTAMNAPTGLNVMWNTAIILPALLMTPITASLGATTSVALLMIAAPLLAASLTYWVLHRMTGSLLGAAVGATVYGFGPFYAAQQGHVHLTLGSAFLPLILYYGYRMVTAEHLSWRRLGWPLGVVVAVVMLISEEVVAIAAVIAALSLVALCLKYGDEIRQRRAKILKSAGWAAGIAFVLCGPALAYQFLGPLVIHEGIHSSTVIDLTWTLRPSRSQYFSAGTGPADGSGFAGNGIENTGYLGIFGFVATVGALVLLYRTNHRRLVFWLGSTAGIACALSLGTSVRFNGWQTYVPMPWLFLSRVPVLETLVPARFSVLTLLLVATILAFGIAALPRAGSTVGAAAARRLRLGGYVVLALALVAWWPAGRNDRLDIATPQFFTSSAVDTLGSGSVVLALPQAETPNGAAAVMKWQIDAEMRFSIIGGYSFFSRDGFPTYRGEIPAYGKLLQQIGESGTAPTTAETTAARHSVLTSVGDYVVVTDQVAHVPAVVDALTEIGGCVPRRVSDVYVCKIAR